MQSEEISVVLAALYLPGLPRSHDPSRRRWRCVETALRRAPTLSATDALSRAGLWEEAHVLDSKGLLCEARRAVRKMAVTAADPEYPRGWLERLGASGPPALWRRGEIPKGPIVAIVGCRHVSHSILAFAAATAREAARLGCAVVSGGAQGSDSAAVAGAAAAGGRTLEILPHGLGRRSRTGSCQMSMVAPDAAFSVAAAMERNTLVYAATEATVVVQTRFKEGGTWHGAINALRRGLCNVIVREDPDDIGARALIALGAVPLRSPEELGEAMMAMEGQARLAV